MDLDKSENNFLAELLDVTDQQFKKSPVYQKQLKLGKRWNYSICATPISKGKGVLFGINWGGDDNSPQTIMPSGQDVENYHFIKQIRKYLDPQWNLDFTTINFNYTNLCFFRTPKQSCLSLGDYELSLPLFERYIRYINPPWILSIGVSNLRILNRLGALSNLKDHYDNQGKFRGQSGRLWGWHFFSVPHPSAHLTRESRLEIWSAVTQEMVRATNR